MPRRTINNPGVEINEIDNTIVNQRAGTSILVVGFASKGPIYEPLVVTSVSEFEDIFGLPTNDPERYLYHNIRSILKSPATITVVRIPYTTSNPGEIDEYSVLAYPVIPLTQKGLIEPSPSPGSPSVTPSITLSPVDPSVTPTPTVTPTVTPTRSVTPTVTPTKSVTPTVTPSPPNVTPSTSSGQCLTTLNGASADGIIEVTAAGGYYVFDGISSNSNRFAITNGVYEFRNVPSSHPIAFYNNGVPELQYTGTSSEGAKTGQDNNIYTYYYGTVTVTVTGDIGAMSYECYNHGYMGGENNLVYKSACVGPTPTPSVTPTNTVTPSVTPTNTPTLTPTNTPTPTPTANAWLTNMLLDFNPTQSSSRVTAGDGSLHVLDSSTSIADENGVSANNYKLFGGTTSFTTASSISCVYVENNVGYCAADTDDVYVVDREVTDDLRTGFTWCAWIYIPSTYTSYFWIMGQGLESSSIDDGMGFGVMDSGNDRRLQVIYNGFRWQAGQDSVETDKWQFVTIAVPPLSSRPVGGTPEESSIVIDMYINGSANANLYEGGHSFLRTDATDNTKPTYIGSFGGTGSYGHYGTGYIGRVITFNRYLSASEVANVYESYRLVAPTPSVTPTKSVTPTVTPTVTPSITPSPTPSTLTCVLTAQIADETANNNYMCMYGNNWSKTGDSAVGLSALRFEGGTDYGIIHEPYQNVLSSPWSFSMWYKPDEANAGGNDMPELFHTTNSANQLGWMIYHAHERLYYFCHLSAGQGYTQIQSSNNIITTDWQHIVYVIDEYGNPTLYYNGASATLTTDSTPNSAHISNYDYRNSPYSLSGIGIGSADTDHLGYQIDDVSLWSTELSPTDVSTLYGSGTGANLTGMSNLEGWWKMGD